MSRQVQVAKQKNKNTRVARGLVWFAAFVNVVLLLMLCAVASNPTGTAFVILSALLIDVAVAAYAISQSLVFELIIEHKWKKVCQGLGGNFVGQGRAQYKTKVRLDPISSVRDGGWERKTIYPKLRNVQGSSDSWTGVVYPLYGQNVDDYTKQADRFALAFHVPSVTFQIAQNGLIAIRAGKMPIPAAYNFQEQRKWDSKRN